METSRVVDARARYFADNGFSEAEYSRPWATVKLGPFRLWFPNPRSRQRAIRLHDLHHIATGYPTTWIGEAEISAWELGGGCGRYWAAWMLDLAAFGFGVVVAPRRMWRAFVRGRHARPLYRTGWSDDLLDITVDELRARVGLDAAPRPATWRDRGAFTCACVALLSAPVGFAAAIVGALLA